MKLYIKQKVFSIGDRYNVTDGDGNVIFSVQGEIFTWGSKLHIFDASGSEVFFITRKLLRFMPEYAIYSGGVQCATIHKRFTLFSHSISIESQYGMFEINGDIWGMCFDIMCNGSLLGRIDKKWLSWGDSYCLAVQDDSNAAFFVAIVIAIDNCIHNGNN